MYFHIDICTHVFTAPLFVIASNYGKDMISEMESRLSGGGEGGGEGAGVAIKGIMREPCMILPLPCSSPILSTLAG